MKQQERASKSKSGICKTCSICKKEAWVFPYQVKRRKSQNFFCSPSCKNIYVLPIMLEASHNACRGKKQSPENVAKRKLALPNGKKHHAWKGENAGYRALHIWVQNKLGKPHECQVCGDTSLRHRQYHWANISGQYLRDTEDWQRMCVTCHKRYDVEMRLLGITEMAY